MMRSPFDLRGRLPPRLVNSLRRHETLKLLRLLSTMIIFGVADKLSAALIIKNDTKLPLVVF